MKIGKAIVEKSEAAEVFAWISCCDLMKGRDRYYFLSRNRVAISVYILDTSGSQSRETYSFGL